MAITITEKIIVKALKIFAGMNPDITPNSLRRVRNISDRSKFHHIINPAIKVEKERTKNGLTFLHLSIKKPTFSPPERTLFFVHGGVFMADLHPFYVNTAYLLMRKLNCTEAILPDYRTLPEYRYPTQLNDVAEVWETVTEKMNVPPNKILISGDSAGGNLALALMLKLRDENREMPMAGAFFSPWADMLCEGESYKFNYEKDAMFGNKAVGSHEERRKRLIQSEIFSYANHLSEDERKHPYVSPVYGSYKGFPPVFISAGENEMLLSDSETIGKKLTEAGSKVTMVKGEGMFHIYALFTLLPQARVAMKELENFSGSI